MLASLMVASNPKSRYLCTENSLACFGGRPTELALSLIAARNSSASLDGLARLVRMKFDAGLAEDYRCHVLSKGPKIAARLAKLDAGRLVNECGSEVKALRKREETGFAELDVDRVCSSALEIGQTIKSLIEGLRAQTKCE
jgi:hypothetical protein